MLLRDLLYRSPADAGSGADTGDADDNAHDLEGQETEDQETPGGSVGDLSE
jgi:hypothetical protein